LDKLVISWYMDYGLEAVFMGGGGSLGSGGVAPGQLVRGKKGPFVPGPHGRSLSVSELGPSRTRLSYSLSLSPLFRLGRLPVQTRSLGMALPNTGIMKLNAREQMAIKEELIN
jgi:hypothetical protein